MRRWIFGAAGLVAIVVAVAVFLVAAGLMPLPGAGAAQDGRSIAVGPGSDTTLPASDGAPEVYLPRGAVSGSGTLKVEPVSGPEGRNGWNISLSGAQLTGTATLRFKNVVTEGQPAPLIGFNEKQNDSLQYVLESRVVGSDIEVTTTHFSNWFTDSWDWLSAWAKERFRQYLTSTHGEDPTCLNEASARAGGVTVTSDDGDRVKWCMGKASDNTTVLKVNNARGYAVSAESSPGMKLTKRGNEAGQAFPRLVGKLITAPSRSGNTVDIIAPGETVEYTVDVGSVSAAGVRLEPSPAAYLATALWFGVETAGMAAMKVFGKIDLSTVADAMTAVDCVSGLQAMSSAQVTDAKAAAQYLSGAVTTVMPCVGKTFDRIAKGKLLDILAVSIAQVFSWLVGGIQTVVAGVQAAIETVMYIGGYRITVSSAPEAVEPALKTFTGNPLGTQFTFDYPADWSVAAGQYSGWTIKNGRGTEIATLDVLATWDASGAWQPRPVSSETTLASKGKLSANGTGPADFKSAPFSVRTIVMDLTSYPSDQKNSHWPKPVAINVSLSTAQVPSSTLIPPLLYGVGAIKANDQGNGWPSAAVIFQGQRFFNTVADAEAWKRTGEYRQIQDMIASFNG